MPSTLHIIFGETRPTSSLEMTTGFFEKTMACILPPNRTNGSYARKKYIKVAEMCKLEAVKKEFLFKGYGPKRKHKLRKLKQSAQLKSREEEQPETAHATPQSKDGICAMG